MCRGDGYLSNQKYDCSSMFATRGPQLLAPSSSDAGQSQSQKTALHRQTLLKPKGNSTLIGAVWEFTLVKWRRKRNSKTRYAAYRKQFLPRARETLAEHLDQKWGTISGIVFKRMTPARSTGSLRKNHLPPSIVDSACASKS